MGSNRRTLLLILLLAVPCLAQDPNFRATVGISACGSCGTRNPTLSAGLGGDVRINDSFTLDLNAAVRRTRKIPGEGYSFAGEASLRVGKELFGIGGVSVTRQLSEHFTKTSTNVFGGVGYRKDSAVLSGVYFLPDFSSPNKVQGGRFKAEFFLKRHIYLAPHAAVFSFRCNQGPVGLTDRCTSSEVGVQAGFYFK